MDIKELADLICKADTCSTRNDCEGGGICHDCQIIARAVAEWFKQNSYIQLASLNPEMKPVDISEMYLDRDKAEQFVFQYYWKQFDHNSIKSLAEYNKVIPLDGAGLVHSAHIKGRDDGIKAQLAADQLTRDKKREELEARNKELVDVLKSVQKWLMFPEEIKEDGVWNEQFVKANNLVNQALAQEKG